MRYSQFETASGCSHKTPVILSSKDTATQVSHEATLQTAVLLVPEKNAPTNTASKRSTDKTFVCLLYLQLKSRLTETPNQHETRPKRPTPRHQHHVCLHVHCRCLTTHKKSRISYLRNTSLRRPAALSTASQIVGATTPLSTRASMHTLPNNSNTPKHYLEVCSWPTHPSAATLGKKYQTSELRPLGDNSLFRETNMVTKYDKGGPNRQNHLENKKTPGDARTDHRI